MTRAERTRDAQARFAALLVRLESGEPVEWPSELQRDPELAPLHAGWLRAEHAFARLHDSDLRDEAWNEARGESSQAGLDRLRQRLRAEDRSQVRYQELETLARGGMGVVTRVLDRDLGRELALKTVIDTRPRAQARFVREVRVVARLEHPSILPVHDLGVDASGRLFFTMPLVRGRTLEAVLADPEHVVQGWSRARFVDLCLRVVEALAHAHERGVVHRDIKPGNILIGPHGETYLTDWGLARLAGEPEEQPGEENGALPAGATAHGAVLGTAHYMAPEQARGELARVGPRSDLFALGAVLYHALAKRRPRGELVDEAALEAARRGRRIPFEREDDVPEELAAIVERAMAPEAAQRYGAATELAADLRAFLEGRVVRAHARGAWVELRKWFVRNRRAASAGSLVALLLAAAIGWAVTSGARAEREITRLSDARQASELLARAEALWPALPERERELARWIEEAAVLRARLPLHTAALERLRERALRPATGNGFVFEDGEDRWVHDTLAALVLELQRWERPDPRQSRFADVAARLEFARSIRARSIEQASSAWAAARAGVRASSQYAGLELAPQLGLVPLGPDPHSGLWEFAHLASGEVPLRDAQGELLLTTASAVVLVLLPGGSAQLGSVTPGGAGEAERSLADLLAEPDETPRIELSLAPFFLAKHELTRAQHARLDLEAREFRGSGLEAMETIAWNEASAALERAALTLPTEAQWECAARAASTTRFWCGAEVATLFGRVNAGWASDGRALHAGPLPRVLAVDTLAPNSWGLHHVAGNVAEWIADAYLPTLAGPRRERDGLLLAPDLGLHVVRGGGFASEPRALRSAAREPRVTRAREAGLGMRAARPLDP